MTVTQGSLPPLYCREQGETVRKANPSFPAHRDFIAPIKSRKGPKPQKIASRGPVRRTSNLTGHTAAAADEKA
eukprot:59963-Hanusia_phi.AAC.1